MHLDKFKGAYFKYDDSFFTFLPKHTQIRHYKNVHLDIFEGAGVKYDHSFFRLLFKTAQLRRFFVLVLIFFLFWMKLSMSKNMGVLI